MPGNISNSERRKSHKNHILSCDSCSMVEFDLNDFLILHPCKSEFHSRLYKALLIRKTNPNLNHQLYAIETSFLYNKFKKCPCFFT